MKIAVLGEGCKACDTLYINTLDAVTTLGIDADVEKIENLIEIVSLGVMSAPSLMIDGKVAVSGRVASPAEICSILKKKA